MAIQQGDIALVKSQVMLDTSNGGGAPTGSIIQNGASNSIFPDISELDRAGGRVSVRKVFPSVRAPGTDGYYGVNVIVSEPPADPNVAVTLFSTGDVFDRRDAAVKRMQSYLARGSVWSGYLFGNHIAGQMNVTLIQKVEVELPSVGQTMMLSGQIGNVETQVDYFRIVSVASNVRTFSDAQGDFQRKIVVLGISLELSADYKGFDAQRYDNDYDTRNATRVLNTIVADAAHYYGVTRLAQTANANDYVIKGKSVYTQLVPSSRVEEPLVDVRPNQRSAALAAAGSSITDSISGYLTTTQSLYIGGGIVPGSLSVERDSIKLTDSGGILVASGQTVGTVDYSNGILALSTNVFGGGVGTHVVKYTPAASITVVTDSYSQPVTAENNRRSWTMTIDPPPARGSLVVSYRALGRWYVLTDDGSGALRGTDSSFGAGSVNFVTGGASVTLGALPDVRSKVLWQWAPIQTVRTATDAVLPLDQRLKAFIKLPADTVIAPGSLTVSWDRPSGEHQIATDDELGQLAGDAVGAVVYGKSGGFYFSPNWLPNVGAELSITLMGAEDKSGHVAQLTDYNVDFFTCSLAVSVRPGSFECAVNVMYTQEVQAKTPTSIYDVARIYDDGAGHLCADQLGESGVSPYAVGTIDYSNGVLYVAKKIPVIRSVPEWKEVPGEKDKNGNSTVSGYTLAGNSAKTIKATVSPASSGAASLSQTWNWWGGALTYGLIYRCAGSDTAPVTLTHKLDTLFFELLPVGGDYTQETVYPRYVRLGQTKMVYVRTGFGYDVVANLRPNTGSGTIVGKTSASRTTLTDWPAEAYAEPDIVAAAINPKIGSTQAGGVTRITFRSATAPLYAGAFQLAGAWSDTGETFTATANSQGFIDTCSEPPTPETHGSRGVVGYVDYETGCCEVAFGQKIGANVTPASVSYVDPQTGLMRPAVYVGGMNVESLGITGLDEIKAAAVDPDSMRYNATGFSYVSLDPEILGLDPTMLPNDGLVPMVRKGGFVVLGHTGELAAQTVINGQSVSCGRVRLSRVEVIGSDGVQIDTGYTADLDAGTVTFTDVAGYAQPVKIKHRIEDMVQVRDVQIDGTLSLTRKITHSYPADESTISSALVIGDMQVNTPVLFDQSTWLEDWKDTRVGTAATGTYDDAGSPVELSNLGAVSERWALLFQTNTTFLVIGEHVGVIGQGSTNADCAPNNPATGTPYFTLRAAGWGAGWAAGNVLRFNTTGAVAPVWVVRTIQPGTATVENDSFALLVRGDVDRP
jgi:hypothetical protein